MRTMADDDNASVPDRVFKLTDEARVAIVTELQLHSVPIGAHARSGLLLAHVKSVRPLKKRVSVMVPLLRGATAEDYDGVRPSLATSGLPDVRAGKNNKLNFLWPKMARLGPRF